MPTPIPARSRHPLAWRLVAAVTLALLGALLALAPAQAAGTIRYAAPGGATSGTCDGNWANACTLAYALAVATSGDQVWVKAGVHTPTTNSSDRGASFVLKSGVAIYGGFAGTETALSQRDWVTNKTILSGDIEGNDTTDASGVVTSTAGITGTNSYHVVRADNVDGGAALDGFIITAGKANATVFPNNAGGGLYHFQSALTLHNLVFIANTARDSGGGMYSYDSNPRLINVVFSGNTSDHFGGGMTNDFRSDATLINVTFSGNVANLDDSINAGGGGMFNITSNPTLIHVTFSSNRADAKGYGGAIYNTGFNTTTTPVLRNANLWGNMASSGSNIYNDSSIPTITYSNIQGCGSSTSWNTACGTNGGGNIDADPLFADADGPDNTPGTLDDNLRLKGGSPVIDAGNNSFVPAGVTTDLDGKPRIQDGNGDNVAVVDMGAYEAPANRRPIANAGPDQSVSVGQLVTLNGSGSSDPDNNLPLSYAWSQSGGPSVTLSGATTATPSFTPTAVGVYTFTLVVTDSAGLASAPDQVVITVTNQPLLRLYLPLVTRQP